MHGDDYRNMKAKGGQDHESYSRMESEEMAPKAKDEAGWELEYVSLRKAENGGIIATCNKTKPMKGKGQMGPSRDYQSKDYAFAGVDEALEFARAELAGSPSSGSSGAATLAMARG